MYEVPDQTGRRIVITGANSGTGKEATKRLAAAGASIVMAVRTVSKGEDARAEIMREVPGADLEVRRIDLADLATVHEFARDLIAERRVVDTLVNNAGVMTPPDRIETADDHELQWGSNFLGPFALTNLLLPHLMTAANPRVVTMSSAVANWARIDIADLDAQRSYSPVKAYGQSKLANLLMGVHLARVARERGWPLRSTMAHPGRTHTNLLTAGRSLGSHETLMSRVAGLPFVPIQSVDIGTEPLLFAAASHTAINGAYYGPGGRMGLVGETVRTPIPRSAQGPTLAASLWAIGEAITGTRLPS